MIFEKALNPVIDTVWNIQLCHFGHDCCLPHRVERFSEVEREDTDELVRWQLYADGMQQSNDGGSCRTRWPEYKLVIETKSWMWEV